MTVLLLAFALLQPNPDTLSAQAADLAAAGRTQEAEGLWRRAVELTPAHFPSLFNLGFLMTRQGREDEAAQWLQRAAKANPKDFNSLYLLGTIASRRNATDDALRAWRAALVLQPANRKLMQVMAVEYSKGRYFEEAARVAESALRLAPDELPLYLLAIKARQDAGQPEAAQALARQALAKFPQSGRANFEVGFYLHKVGRWEEALPYFDKAIAAEPAYEEPYYFRADVLLRRDQPEPAAADFRRALERRADYTVARLGLARALMAQGNLPAAAEELQEAARRDAANPQPFLLLSQVLFRLGKLEESKVAKETSQRLRLAAPERMNVPQGRPFQ